MSDKRVVITGIGLIGANGKTRDEVFFNCVRGVDGLKKNTLFDMSSLQTEYVGQIPLSELPFLPETPFSDDRADAIIDIVLKEAFSDSGLSKEDIEKEGSRTAVSFATMLTQIPYIEGFKNENNPDLKIPWITNTFSPLLRLKKNCGVKGGFFVNTSACASGTLALGTAYDLIVSGKADIVISGGVDPLSDFSCYGFNSLKSLSPGKTKPFDKNRDGITIGEGGAVLIVESEEHALRRNAKIYCEITGYGSNNDAYHNTSPDPNGFGARATFLTSLNGEKPENVSYINAHGTGTPANDIMEASAVSEVFGKNKNLVVSSTKSALGHCMGAAGALEAGICAMCVKYDVLPPTIRSSEFLDECANNDYNLTKREKPVNVVLSDSFAFGGNAACIMFKKYMRNE